MRLMAFAFEGNNPNFRSMQVIAPIGVSRYNALTVSLRGRLGNWKAFRNMTTTVSYALSRFESSGAEPDVGFLSLPLNNDDPEKYLGPSNLDRTHQFSVSLLTNLPWNFTLSTIMRISSPLSQSAVLPLASGTGEIFFTDLDGDGTVQDLLPDTSRGSFGRDVDVSRLNQLITNLNGQVTSGFTPAAQALISTGLFTAAQLRSLGATINAGRAVALAPTNQVGLDTFSTTDVRVSRVIHLNERVRIEPMIEVFNLFNIGNYDPPGNRLSSILTGSPGSINGTTSGTRSNRYGLGSGSFAPGSATRVPVWSPRRFLIHKDINMAEPTRQLSKDIGPSEFFTLAFGSIIGVGWVVALTAWLTQAGPIGAVLGFAGGGLLMMLVGLCYVEISTMFPVSVVKWSIPMRSTAPDCASQSAGCTPSLTSPSRPLKRSRSAGSRARSFPVFREERSTRSEAARSNPAVCC